jgi:outer membrane immunogenic protein
MKKLVLALAAVAAFTGSASAADMAVKARPAPPPPPPVANWTGCYIAGSVGYGLFDNETIGRDTGLFTENTPGLATARVDHGGRGWLAGGGGGCDYQFGFGGGGGFFGTGQFVIGVLADGYWANMKGDRTSVFANADGFGGTSFSGQEKIDSQWAVGGRIGWLVNPQTLTYFSGGYTEARLTGVGDFFTPVCCFSPTNLGVSLPSRTVHGWFLGGGVEYQSGWIPNLTWKTEYRFSEYDRADRPEFFNGGGFFTGIPVGTPTGTFSSDKLFVQTVMTSLVYRFNWGGPAVAARY